MKIKNILVTVVTLMAFGMAVAAEQPTGGAMAKAMGGIAEIVQNPSKMTAAMKTLTAAEQKQFVAAVNEAIATGPASKAEKAAKYVNVAAAALKGAAKGNVSALIAEIVATVKIEALPAVCENIGQNMINRAADPNVTYTDKQFTIIATELIKTINERTAEADNALPRSATAIAMLVGASNGSPKDLGDTLVNTLPEKDRAVVKNEWLPAATGSEGGEKNFEPILAAANAEESANIEVVLTIAGPQQFAALMTDVATMDSTASALADGSISLANAALSMANPIAQQPAMSDQVSEQARTSQPAGADVDPTTGKPIPDPGPEPKPYSGQIL